MQAPHLNSDISDTLIKQVASALEEDIRDGDITAQLIPETNTLSANIVSNEDAVICGLPWVQETFKQLDPSEESWKIEFHVTEGERVTAGSTIFSISGNARLLLTGERTALNFLQTLSGTATTAYSYAQLVKNTSITILDTRKTVPGLRLAQKYAVKVGGCSNHRIGLYDAFLIKENHIAACGSITAAVTAAKTQQPNKPIEVEVENLTEFAEAQMAGADIIMLDNFSLADIEKAVENRNETVKIEVSGNIDKKNLHMLSQTGVDFISSGALTKHVRALDFSMRFSN